MAPQPSHGEEMHTYVLIQCVSVVLAVFFWDLLVPTSIRFSLVSTVNPMKIYSIEKSCKIESRNYTGWTELTTRAWSHIFLSAWKLQALLLVCCLGSEKVLLALAYPQPQQHIILKLRFWGEVELFLWYPLHIEPTRSASLLCFTMSLTLQDPDPKTGSRGKSREDDVWMICRSVGAYTNQTMIQFQNPPCVNKLIS